MPPKKANAADTAAVTKLWEKLEAALIATDKVARGDLTTMDASLKKNRVSWYGEIYGCCASNVASMKELHEKIQQFVKTYLAPKLKERILPTIVAERSGEADSGRLFDVVAKVYAEFRISKDFAEAVASSLDQGLSGREGVPKLRQLYLKAFHDLVYNDVKGPLRDSILRNVATRRDGNAVDMKTLKNAAEFLVTVGTSAATQESEQDEIYHADFEKQYLEVLSAAYRGKAVAELSKEGGHYTYLQWVESRFELERTLAIDLTRRSSHNKVMALMEELLLRDQMKQVIEHPDSGLSSLLEDWKETDIARMYNLFKRVPNNEAIKLMGVQLKKTVTAMGKVPFATFASESPTQDRPLVESLVELHTKFSNLVKRSCENSGELHTAIRDAFQACVNDPMKRKDQRPGGSIDERETTFAEVLVNYIDLAMRKELKDISDPDAEMERLEQLAIQFNHIKEKDVFQEVYKTRLAKRLLQGSVDQDLERAFLQNVQKLMGSSFTHKMECMLNDINGAKATHDGFMEKYSNRVPEGVNFFCQVLAAGSWPAYKPDSMNPCGSLAVCMRAFELYYKTKYATRQLSWLNALGNCSLNIKFDKGPKEVAVSTYQGHILLNVDMKGKMTGKEIAEAMNLDWEKIVKPNVHSVFLAKLYPLLCTGVDADGKSNTPQPLKGDEPLMLNPNFTYKMRKFKVPALGNVTGVNKEEMDKSRGVVIEACIVRIMKARRVLLYPELLDSVVSQLSKLFTPNPRQIKVCVEALVTREYLKRDPDVQGKFEYLA